MDPIYTSNYWYYTYFPIILGSWNVNNTNQIFPTFPIYGFYYNPAVAQSSQVVSRLNALVSNVQEASQEFFGEGNVFNERTLEVSTSAVTGTVEKGAPVGTYTISVSQLAQAQINTGSWLDTGSLSFSTGTQTFKITVGTNEYEFNIDVTSSDTNLSVLDKIAEAINSANIGITANVEISGTQARLVLEGRTGEENAFTVEDVVGNIVNVSGISNVTQTAQNLVYTVNGQTQESSTNTIQLEGVTLNVNELPEGEFTVSVNYNAEEIRSAVENLVENLNELRSFVNQNAQYLSPSVQAIVENITNNPMLNTIGVENENGNLNITERFNELLENPNLIENLVQPTVENVASSIQTAVNSIQTLSSYQILSPVAMPTSMNLTSIYDFVRSYANNLLFQYTVSAFNYFA